MGIEQSKFIFEDIKDENKVLSISNFVKNMDYYLENPYYFTQDYYSKILLFEYLEQKDRLYIYPINIDTINLKLIIKKNGKVLYNNKINKEKFIESIKIINDVLKYTRRVLGFLSNKKNSNKLKNKKEYLTILLERIESQDDNLKKKTLAEINKIKIEIELLEKEKSIALQNFNNPLPKILEKKEKKLNEYEEVLINNLDRKLPTNLIEIGIILDDLIIFDYSDFDKNLLNTDSELKLNNLDNDELLKYINKIQINNESFSYFIKDLLSDNKIYFIRNFEENNKLIKFSIIKNNELITYSGSKNKLKEFLNENFKNQKIYIINYLDTNNEKVLKSKVERSIKKDKSSYSTINLFLPLITGYLYFKKR